VNATLEHTQVSLEEVQNAEQSLLLSTYERYPVLLERGEGVYLFDAKGRRYLDFLSGIGVNALGYGHPAILPVLQEQAAKLVHCSNLFFHEHQARLAELLTKASGMEKVFFCNSGTEAWECALKLARAHARSKSDRKPKSRLLVMEDSFHGRTMGSLATTGQKKYRAPFAPLMPGVTFVKFNDVAHLNAKFDDSVCAVGLETVQGEGGVRPVSQEFLAVARELTERSGALLLLDEIQCGLGRTGKAFAYQQYGIQPDVVTVAKPLAAGLPLGAVLTTGKAAAAFRPGMHGTTFGGGPLTCAVGCAFMQALTPDLLAHVSELGAYFAQELRRLQQTHPCIVDVRGLGLMVAAELDSGDLAKDIVRQALEAGIVINRTHDTTLRFLPPYIIERAHIDELIAVLNCALPRQASGKPSRKKGKK
jgi:acetylornithine aminotransferase/acetylornithine/N-succinyldiaminopimelate aminotransferase